MSLVVVVALIGGMVFTATSAGGQSVTQPGGPDIVGGDEAVRDLILDTPMPESPQDWNSQVLETPEPETSKDRNSAALGAGFASGGSAKCAARNYSEPAKPVPVTGEVIWQTREFQRIPVAFAEICLFDGAGQPLGWSVTDKEGRFAINVEAGKTGIAAVAYTSSGDARLRDFPSVQVKKRGTLEYELYSIQSSQRVSTVGGAPRPLEVVASADTVENRAFSVYQALVRGYYAFKSLLPAGTDLETLVGYYPPPNQFSGTSYYPSSDAMTVDTDDVWDWDVLHHELAHHVGSVTGVLPVLDSSVDTTHALKWNLSQIPAPEAAWTGRTFQDSMSLAWIEGWATYAAISMQQRLKVTDPVLNDVRTFGDSLYEDSTYNGKEVKPINRFSLTSTLLPKGTAPLPDNEVVVAQFLQSLDTYNASSSRANPLPWPVHDLVTLATKDGPIVDAFDAWNRLDARQKLDSCDATNYGFGPQLVRYSLDLTKGPHSITIAPNGPGPNYPNTIFVLSFFDADGDVVGQLNKRFYPVEVEARTTLTIDISDKVWADFAKKGAKSWMLTGRQTAENARYRIRGCTRKIENGAVAKLSVQPVCEAGTGALDGTLKNDGFDEGQYLIVVNGKPSNGGTSLDSPISFERTVGPGDSAAIKLGDLDDGAYVVSVAPIAGDVVNAVSAQQQAQVNCTKALGRDYERNVSCLAANGRVDATLTNIYSSTALYEVVVDNTFTRTMRIAPKETQRTTVTGLADGQHQLKITRTQILDSGQKGNTEQITDEEFSVTCDGHFIGSELIDIRSWCDTSNGKPSGHASIYAKNNEQVGSDFVVTTGGVAGAQRTVVEAGGTALLQFKNLIDRKIEFTVKRNNIEVGRVGADFDCS